MNENLLGIMWNGINTTETLFPSDPNYNVATDQEFMQFVKQDYNYYADSTSRQQTLHLIKQRQKESETQCN